MGISRRFGSATVIRSQSQRRKTSWNLGPRGALSFTVGDTVSGFPTVSQALEGGLTIVRIRGELLLYLEVVTNPNDGFVQCAAGICIVSENAFGVGATAVPDPRVDIGWDGWMWYWTGSMIGLTATENGELGTAAVRIPVDTKAMRKIKDTDGVIGMFAVGTETGAATLTCRLETRMLVKLP